MRSISPYRLLAACLPWAIVFLAGCSSLPKEPVQSTPPNNRAISFLELGHRQYHTGKYENAITSFKKSLSGYASWDDGAGVAKSLCGLGRAQLALGHLDDASSSFRQAIHATNGLMLADLQAQGLGGLAAIELHRQQPQKANEYLDTALNLDLENPGSTRATLLHDKGAAQMKLGSVASAEKNLNEALAMHETLRDLTGIATDCYSLAGLYQTGGNTTAAIENARRALSHDKRAGNSPAVALDLTLLGSLSEKNGDDSQAVDYYRRARLAWQALRQDEMVSEISERLQRISSQ